MKAVRCAIYTRKSSEEGLEQAFNSLDAQREACGAYILSQASEGWTALPDIYDDGGLSGGSLERPALQRLLAEVAAGRVDIIVVYKVDRLTRSLLDFSKLVEAFDKAGTSFVSVTQSFNTTTSMGRLTLNMLLSFAQFEREVTAERIRDKIAASKAKGMWMGGTPPLGYEPDGRSLKVIEPHAALVRRIFERYLAFGNVRRVAEELASEGVTSPLRTRTKTGQTFGGVPFSRGQIYYLLKCPSYVGEVHHNGNVYPALHDAIIDRDTWNRVQAMLAGNLQGHRSGARASRPSPLAGKVFDAAGAPLIATHACKLMRGEAGSSRYRYYVSRALQHDAASEGLRIPALELEAAVAQTAIAALADPLVFAEQLQVAVRPVELGVINARCAALAEQLSQQERAVPSSLIARVIVSPHDIAVTLEPAVLAQLFGELPAGAPAIVLRLPVRLTRTGRVLKLVQPGGRALAVAPPNASLVRVLAQANDWAGRLRGGSLDIAMLASEVGKSRSYVSRVVRLAYLAPDVVEAILAGRQRATMGTDALTAPNAIPAAWAEQRSAFLHR